MRKNLKILHINGFRGLFLFIFIVICLIAGFIFFPAFLSMHTWNYLAVKTNSFPSITFAQGLLLWAIIAFGTYIFSRKNFIVFMKVPQELTEKEVSDVVSKIKDINSTFNEELKEEEIIKK